MPGDGTAEENAARNVSDNAGNNAPRPDLNIVPYITPENPEEAAITWGKWRKGFIRKLRFFRITQLADMLDALAIYGGDEIEELLDTLPAIPDTDIIPPSGESLNDFHRAIAKLDAHFTPMQNKDSDRAQFDIMEQGELSMAKYYVALRKQAEKCVFPDQDDAIRTKILLTMKDKKLRREAMLKNYTLSALLKNAANKEDVERQAVNMEKVSHPDAANRVYEQKKTRRPFKKFRKPASESGQKKHKESAGEKHKQSVSESHNHNPRKKNCCYCGMNHPGPRSKCPASGQTCNNCSKKGHFAVVCKKRRQQTFHVGDEPTQYTDSDNSDFVFSVSTGKKRPTVAVMINGIKGHMEADSGASANIMDKEQFHKIINACREPIQLMPANNQVFAYGQSEPMALAGKFTAPIRSLSTNIQTNAEFIVLAQKQANSKPLLSLETGIALDVIHIANRTQLTKEDELSNRVEKAYPEVFTGLGKHKSIKAKFIIDSTVEPIVQKPRKVPYNLEKQVEEEEERLLAMGILETVPDEVPTTWCTNPVVAPKKNGKIRFCSNM